MTSCGRDAASTSLQLKSYLFFKQGDAKDKKKITPRTTGLPRGAWASAVRFGRRLHHLPFAAVPVWALATGQRMRRRALRAGESAFDCDTARRKAGRLFAFSPLTGCCKLATSYTYVLYQRYIAVSITLFTVFSPSLSLLSLSLLSLFTANSLAHPYFKVMGVKISATKPSLPEGTVFCLCTLLFKTVSTLF
jgi:hypothetical protein